MVGVETSRSTVPVILPATEFAGMSAAPFTWGITVCERKTVNTRLLFKLQETEFGPPTALVAVTMAVHALEISEPIDLLSKKSIFGYLNLGPRARSGRTVTSGRPISKRQNQSLSSRCLFLGRLEESTGWVLVLNRVG